jgi:hypothetical protein
MTQADDRVTLAHAGLDRLAEQRGDITAEVIARYYAAMPDARASFEHHGGNDVAGLEARMVAEAVFTLLRWVEEPIASKIDQGTTVVHHNDALEIPPRWYMGLVDAVLALVHETLPPDATAERKMWLDVREEVARFIDSLQCEFVRTIDAQKLVPD